MRVPGMRRLLLCKHCKGVLAKRYNTLKKFQQQKYVKTREAVLQQLNIYIIFGVAVDLEEYHK